MSIKVIVFDFDGVLADSFDVLYNLNREAMVLVGVSLSREQYRDLFDTNIHQGFRRLILDETAYNSFIAFKKENFASRYEGVGVFPGITSAVRDLAGRYTLAISSSTLKEYISTFLKKNRIDDCFKYIVGNQDHSKAKGIEEIKNNLGYQYLDMIMVSDTTADLAVAKELGMMTAAVTWGFHDPAKLSLLVPTVIIDSPTKLILSLTSL